MQNPSLADPPGYGEKSHGPPQQTTIPYAGQSTQQPPSQSLYPVANPAPIAAPGAPVVLQTGYNAYNAPYVTSQPGTIVYQNAVPGQQVTIIDAGRVMPEDHFIFALVVTICCCFPLGLVAIIKSSEVKNRAAAGDLAGANAASSSAKGWSWAGFIIGGILWLVGIICFSIYMALLVQCC